jgi:hypothetical protein
MREKATEAESSLPETPAETPAEAARRVREERLFELWQDGASWRGNVFLPWYHCAEDGRILVPRKKRWAGWTINFAHRLAWPTMVLGAIVGFGPSLLLLHLLRDTGYEAGAALVGLALSLRALVSGARYLSTHEV